MIEGMPNCVSSAVACGLAGRAQQRSLSMGRSVARVVLLFLVLSLAMVFPARRVAAQSGGDPVTIGEWRTIDSEILGEERRVIVSTPDGYEEGDGRYVAIYLLDGDFHFSHTVGLVDFLVANDLMPPAIVIAVPNTDRTRDLTPPTREDDPQFATAGGADDFIAFFRDELTPFIDAAYRTSGYRALIGHSFGGLFALHTLVHEPDLFDAFIAISPSLQWDDQRLVEQTEAFFEERGDLDMTLYMTVGNEGSALLGGVLKVAGILEEHAPNGFEWDSRVMKDETHGTVVHRSTRQGLEFVFGRWGLKHPLPLYDREGIDGMLAWLEASSDRYGVERTVGPQAIYGLSIALLQHGRLDEARQALEYDQERFPPLPQFYDFIGSRYLERGDEAGAIACYTRAYELNPASEWARKALVDLGVDPASIAPAFEIDAEALAACAGAYASPESDEVFEVRFADGGLTLIAPGRPQIALSPIGETRFGIAAAPVQFSFERDESGRVTAMVMHAPDGSETRMRRAE
jgi:predicted alpha/beta superfamily hydrolase